MVAVHACYYVRTCLLEFACRALLAWHGMEAYGVCVRVTQDPQGRLWDGVLDGDVEAVKRALDSGASLDGPEGSFEAITSRYVCKDHSGSEASAGSGT